MILIERSNLLPWRGALSVLGFGGRRLAAPAALSQPWTSACNPRHRVIEDRKLALEMINQFFGAIGTAVFADDKNMIQTGNRTKRGIPLG